MVMANRLKTQMGSITKAVDNVNAGIAIMQTMDDGLSSIADVLAEMRDLALSSSTGTTDSTTRTANQVALATYMDDIDSYAAAATWNGTSLLDGTSTSMDLLSGINSGDTTTLSFFSVASSALGEGDPLALTSSGNYVSSGTLSAMAEGDLTIDGYTIGATLSTDDTLSSASKSGSAIAKVAAINRKTSDTNVVAVVGTTTAAGTSMTTATSGAAVITINGTAISLTLSSSDSIETTRAAVAAAINLNSDATGVVATDTDDSSLGVTLSAADGRNIVLAMSGTATAAATGLGATGTYAGNYTLRSTSGDSITIGTLAGKTLSNSDLVAGTYAANTALMVSSQRDGSTSAPTELSSGDMRINGYAIGETFTSDDTASAVTTASTKASSAIAIAAAINRRTSLTGVTAAANDNILTGSSFTAATVSSIFLNGQTIGVSFTSSTSLDEIVTALTPYEGRTGVTATNNGSGLTLTASDGRNISIGLSDGSGAVAGTAIGLGGLGLTGAAATSAGAMGFIGTVSLSSDAAFTISQGTNGTTNMQTLGFMAGTYGGAADDTKVSELDISSQTGGSTALTVIDAAIEMVSAYQTRVGGMATLLDLKVEGLDQSTVTTTAAYGNIVDADIAEETANLTSAQIKSDSASAMLAQANLMTKDMVTYLLQQFA
jgi:flagellin